MRYVHTNIIAKDWKKLSRFYREVFDCRTLPPKRDLAGEWLERLTDIEGAHIEGEHLVLPGYDDDYPTLEIFSYKKMNDSELQALNNRGITHLAFEVEDVEAVLKKLIGHGGTSIGEVVNKEYEEIGRATFVYCRDPEGNIIELQSWEK